MGGIPFTRGPLAYLLRNRFYIGEIVFRGEVFPGEQPAILDRDLFEAVQAKLDVQRNNHTAARAKSESALIGRIYDDRGNRMRRLRAMGIRDKPISAASPWQNCFAERLIGSIRRECVDHVVALGEQHLRRVLRSYARYYNEARTHRSLNKDAPITRPVQRTGHIASHALVGGLHHQYVRI